MIYPGHCHCGAIGFRFETALPVHAWSIRICECEFCRAHGALYTADPAGRVAFNAQIGNRPRRYLFASRTADFLFCENCGVYLGAMTEISGRYFAVLNVNTMRLADLPRPAHRSFEGESVEHRQERRQRTWTLVVNPL